MRAATFARSAVWAASRSSRTLQASRPLRLFSIKAEAASDSKQKALDPNRLSITQTSNPKPLSQPKTLVFGREFTDHMLAIEWTQEDGWLDPKITPYQNLSLDPATCVFHYAFECFEGMKAYKDKDGKVRLFRPDMNMARLNKSASRIALPTFEPTSFIELISKLVNLDSRFIPNQRGYSLYLRPTMIGTQKTLGVGPPGSALLYVIASPVGPYYPTGFKAVSLEATDYAVRAWPGGVGDKKLGANYAPCIVPQLQAASRGYQQNLWLFGEEEYVTEDGRLVEAFGAGTAAIVSPIRTIAWKGKHVDCGLKETEESGETALRVKEWIEAIQYGEEEHEWSVKIA
ncbi:Branched-chain-amino-acid aminotransferase, cytosolic [Metarhizium anisopliae]